MKTVTIDLGPIADPAQLYGILSDALSFPDWFGHNLDALYDCLTEVDEETELVLNNWHDLEYRLGDYTGKLVYVFHCACAENPQLTVTLHP